MTSACPPRPSQRTAYIPSYPRLSAAAGVTESSYQAVSTFSCPVAGRDLSAAYRAATGTAQEETLPLTLEVQFIEDSLYHAFLAQLTPAQAEQMTQQDSMLVVAKGKFQSTGTIDLFSASTLPLSLSTASAAGPSRLSLWTPIQRTPSPTQTAQSAPYVLLAVAPYQQKAQFDLLDAPTSLGLTFRSATPAQTVSELEAILQEAALPASIPCTTCMRRRPSSRTPPSWWTCSPMSLFCSSS